MRVLLADDQMKVRSALRLLLEQEPGLSVVGEAAEAKDLLAQVGTERPDLVLLDWELPDQGGAAILDLHPHPPGTGVDRVLDQLLHHRGRPLHDLARGDLIDQRVGEPPHRMSFLRAFCIHLWQSRHGFTSSGGVSWSVG